MRLPHPIRHVRRLLTPPCSECARYGLKLTGLAEYTPVCQCDSYLLRMEKLTCRKYNNAQCSLVRGTRFCKFERKEDDES